jgi:hypothetical protein
MKNSKTDIYQKYYAEGRVIIQGNAPSKHETAVIKQLRAPGIVTLVPNFDFTRFFEALRDDGIPQEDAKAITLSIKVLEDGAYCRPKEPGSF